MKMSQIEDISTKLLNNSQFIEQIQTNTVIKTITKTKKQQKTIQQKRLSKQFYNNKMLPLTSRIDPDIEVKYHQIIAHMNQKNKVIEEFVRILREFCDWEMFNSRNLDKFANSISKLLVGKDPLKDTFILFERILASKSQQSNKIAVSIKQDMLPFLQNAYNLKQQNTIKSRQVQIRQSKSVMNQKVRQLSSAQMNYKSAAQRLKQANLRSFSHSRQQLQELTLLKRSLIDAQAYLTEVVTIYNMAIEDYMLQYSSLCEQLSSIQTNRKTVIKESISKYIVFQMDAIKNIEYDLSRYAKTIEKMDDKLIIQQKASQDYDITRVQLAKISISNYLTHLAQNNNTDKAITIQQTQNQKKLSEIKKFLDPLKDYCEINNESYHSLVNDINELLNEAQEVFDIKTLKEIVYYSTNYFMLSAVPGVVTDQTEKLMFRRIKVPLINAIVCHPIFSNQPFWERYNNRLSDMVEKQIGIISNHRRPDDHRISTSLLAGDIDFMKKLTSVPIVERIRSKYSKYAAVSSEHLLKSTDSIKCKTQITDSKAHSKDKSHHKNIQDVVYF